MLGVADAPPWSWPSPAQVLVTGDRAVTAAITTVSVERVVLNVMRHLRCDLLDESVGACE